MFDIAKQAERLRLDKLRHYNVLDTPPEEPFDRITRLAKTIMQMPIALISLVDRDRQWFKSRQGVNFCQTPRDESFCTHTIAGNAPLIVPDVLADARFRHLPLVTAEPHVRCYVGVPLRTPDGYNIGALCVMDTRARTVTAEQVAILEDLARLVLDELELRLLATTDSLTGALSRRELVGCAKRDVARARRHGERLSCALVDVDFFKRINDRRGHAAGDQTLQQLIALIKSELREEDYIGRLGGEEFAIIMPMTGGDEAFLIGERLRERVMHTPFAIAGGEIRVTVSIGVAELWQPGGGLDDMLARADAALYAAKSGGRNRSVRQGAAPLSAA